MYIHDLTNAEGARTSSKRVGRGIGSGTGKTSTRGHKGQWARSGGGVRPNFEGGQMPLTRRIPKKGFNNKRFAHAYSVVNLDAFNAFEDGATVGIEELVEAGIVKVVEPYGLKVLGDGTLEQVGNGFKSGDGFGKRANQVCLQKLGREATFERASRQVRVDERRASALLWGERLVKGFDLFTVTLHDDVALELERRRERSVFDRPGFA